MAKWQDIGSTLEIVDGEFKSLEIDNTPIAVYNIAGEFLAIQDNCPHQHMPLADGLVENYCITCPFHGAQFDLRTGEVLAPPACENLVTYQVRVIGNRVEILF